MSQGTVKWFNSEKGFGFIAPDEGGADVFAHYSAIEASGYRSLEENQRVEFEIAQGPQGLQAENIRPICSRRRSATLRDRAARQRSPRTRSRPALANCPRCAVGRTARTGTA